ncbi:phthalate transporter [Moniliophthora roreri]|nr:phthalate transporter [Moniliophthora roreri]
MQSVNFGFQVRLDILCAFWFLPSVRIDSLCWNLLWSLAIIGWSMWIILGPLSLSDSSFCSWRPVSIQFAEYWRHQLCHFLEKGLPHRGCVLMS